MDAALWRDLFHPDVSILEKIIRPILVYVFLIIGLRLAGKRELAQLNAFDLVVLSLWDDAGDDARQIAWTRAFYDAMKPWSAALVYVNALGDDDGDRVREAYGDNYARLAQVKTKYDPQNRFRRNQNIPPLRPTDAQDLARYPAPRTRDEAAAP